MKPSALRGAIVYLVVAFVIPWVGWLGVRNDALSLWVFPLFASIGGFAAAFAEGGPRGLAMFARRVCGIAGAMRSVLLALAIPLALGLAYLVATGVSVAGALADPRALLGTWLLAAVVTGPLAEEFGWRGYVQYRLLARCTPFWTALITGVVWWAWHIGLYRDSVFASVPSALRFLAYLETWSLFAVFLVQRARGSVWPAIALHWAANTHPGVLHALLPTVDGGVLPGGSKGWLFYLGAALVFVVIQRRFYFARQRVAVEAGEDVASDAAALHESTHERHPRS